MTGNIIRAARVACKKPPRQSSPTSRSMFRGSSRRGHLLYALDRMMALLCKGKVFFQEVGSFRKDHQEGDTCLASQIR